MNEHLLLNILFFSCVQPQNIFYHQGLKGGQKHILCKQQQQETASSFDAGTQRQSKFMTLQTMTSPWGDFAIQICLISQRASLNPTSLVWGPPVQWLLLGLRQLQGLSAYYNVNTDIEFAWQGLEEKHQQFCGQKQRHSQFVLNPFIHTCKGWKAGRGNEHRGKHFTDKMHLILLWPHFQTISK